MDFEDIFEHVGTFGLYQVMLYFMLGLISLSGSLQNININFVGGYQEHWCHVPRLAHFPHDVQKHVAIPHDGEDYDSCSFYDLPYDNLTDEDIVSWNRSGLGDVPTKSCESWTFDQSVFVSTIGSEFRLVCDRSWLNQLSSTIFMLGMFVGGLTSGLASDKLGRYKTCVIGLVVNTVAGLVSPFVPEYISFVVVRFLRAASSSWSFLSGFVLVMEVMGPTYRVPLGVLYQVFFSIGFMVVTGIAFAIRDFRWLQLVLALAALPNLLLIGIFPESPMWLIARGRVKEAEDFVRKIAVINQRTLPEDFSLEPEKYTKKGYDAESVVKGKFSDICESVILRKQLVLVYFNWFTTSLVYYGLSLNAGAFGDVFLNTFLSGLIEIPANLLCIWCLEKGGRRVPNAAVLLVGGAFCLACVPVTITRPDMNRLLTALATLGKGAVTFAFSAVYVYSAEMFHTPVRHLAVGSASMFSRVGSMISPYIGQPLADVWQPGPSLVFGVISIICGGVCFLLPETKGYLLPDTRQEAEAIARGLLVHQGSAPGRRTSTRWRSGTLDQAYVNPSFPQPGDEDRDVKYPDNYPDVYTVDVGGNRSKGGHDTHTQDVERTRL